MVPWLWPAIGGAALVSLAAGLAGGWYVHAGWHASDLRAAEKKAHEAEVALVECRGHNRQYQTTLDRIDEESKRRTEAAERYRLEVLKAIARRAPLRQEIETHAPKPGQTECDAIGDLIDLYHDRARRLRDHETPAGRGGDPVRDAGADPARAALRDRDRQPLREGPGRDAGP